MGDCGHCRTPFVVSDGAVAGEGEPGGTLPAGVVSDTFLQWNGVLWVPSTWILPEEVQGGDVDNVLTVDGANSSAFEPPPVITGDDFFHLAYGALQVNTGTQFVPPWCSPAGTTIPNNAPGIVAPFNGTLHTMYVTHGSPVAADNITYTVMVNDVATALAVTLNSSASGPVSNLVNVIAVATDDKITVRTQGVAANRAVRPRIQFLLEAA